MNYPPGTWLFAGPDHPETIERAKEYIKVENYTSDTVKMVRTEGKVAVVRK